MKIYAKDYAPTLHEEAILICDKYRLKGLSRILFLHSEKPILENIIKRKIRYFSLKFQHHLSQRLTDVLIKCGKPSPLVGNIKMSVINHEELFDATYN